jgi:hypothetical protein
MTQTITAPAARTAGVTCQAKATKTLLAYGVVAGPLFVTVAGVQALTREGFDIRHHAASLLSNGGPGWIQITNFVLTGLMTIAAAVGVRRALRSGRGATWGPRLLAGYGVGLIGGGIFVADPMNGFPVGAPAGAPDPVSWHGMAHLVVGGLGFLALIAACFVVARRFAAAGQKGWATYSVVTGVVFFAAFAGIASGSGSAGVNVAFAVAVVFAWTWIAALAAHLYRRTL